MVFTGRNRSRPTPIAVAPSKTSIAAPMALSIWITSGDPESAGSTVFSFLINGSPSTAFRSVRVRARAWRSNHRLLVWKYGWRILVGEVVHLLLRRLRRVPQDQLLVGLADGQVAALAVGRGPAADLRRVRRPAGGEPAGEGGIRRGAEIVGVGHRRIAVSQEIPADPARRTRPARCRDRHVRAGTTPGSGLPATSPASGRRRAAWAPGSAGSPARDRRPRDRRSRPARPACRRGCGSCS